MAQTNKGALGQDPQVQASATTADPAAQLRRLETRQKYLQRVRPNDPELKKIANRISGLRGTQSTTTPQPAAGPQEPPQIGEDVFKQMAGYAQAFNPRTFQSEYEPAFGAEMNRARQNVMEQFNRENQQAFAKERQDFETSMANRGISPMSQQYQVELKNLTDRQDAARQSAMSAAESAAYGIQQQGYQQATGAALLPGQITEQFKDPYMTNLLYQYQQGEAQSNFERQKQLMALEQKYKLAQIRATPRGGGGGGGGVDPMAAFNQYLLEQTAGRYGQQQQQPNPYASGLQAGLTTFGSLYGANLGRRGN